MRYRVVMNTGIDSAYCPDRERIADFRHKQHAIGFCEKITAIAYVVDCFDDTVVYVNHN